MAGTPQLQNIAHINVQRNLSFNLNTQIKAVQRTNVHSRSSFQQLVNNKNDVTPQDLGNIARRMSVRDNQNKTPQDRFFDLVV